MRRICELVAERDNTPFPHSHYLHPFSLFGAGASLASGGCGLSLGIWFISLPVETLTLSHTHTHALLPAVFHNVCFCQPTSLLFLILVFTILSSSISWFFFFFSQSLHLCVPLVSLHPSVFHPCVSALILRLVTASLRLITHRLAQQDFKLFLTHLSHLPL